MNPALRERLLRHLDTLPDERAYQVLDYIEFLESKYGEKTAAPASLFHRFTEGVEDTLRAGRVSTTAIAETMGLLNRAVGVLSGVTAAGKSVASDFAAAASRVTRTGEQPAVSAPPAQPAPATPTAPTPPTAETPPTPPTPPAEPPTA